MSLVSTLAKVAVGIAVAKGVKSLTTGGGSPRSTGGGGMLGELLKGATGAGGQRGGSGLGLENVMDGLLKGGSRSGGGASGGLGDILGQLGGGAAAGGGMGGLGGLLTNALENRGSMTQSASREEEDAAGLLIRAMLQAAKADGQVDEEEKQKLLSNLGDLDQQEVAFINAELGKGIDVEGLARDVPRGMESQVYMMSLMGIDLDSQNEAQYLHDLAGAMGMNKSQVNQVHEMLGVQSLYG